MKKNKAIFLYDDQFGLWHIPFFKYLIEILRGNDIDVLLILWSNIPKDKTPDVDIAQITPRYMGENSKERHSVMSIRKKEIQEILDEYHVDIFFVDYFPFGKFWNTWDIDVIISEIRNNEWKVISFMRDLYMWKMFLSEKKIDKIKQHFLDKIWKDVFSLINDDIHLFHHICNVSWLHRIYIVQFMLHYYLNQWYIDEVLVFWDEQVYNITDEFIFPSEVKEKFHHVWYIPFKKNNFPKKINDTTEIKKILVSTWWGVTCEENFFQLLSSLSNIEWIQTKILLWPYVSQNMKKKVQEIWKNKAFQVNDFSTNFQEELNKSDIFFWYWGYGTFLDLFDYKWSAYIMSNYDSNNFRDRFYEQKYRTLLLRDFLDVKFLDNFSKKTIINCIMNNEKFKKKKNIKICSEKNIFQLIQKIWK